MGDEEHIGRDLTAAAGPLGHDRAAESRQAQRDLGRAVGMRDAAADGAAVAGDEVADVRECLAQQRMGSRIVLERCLAYCGADSYDAVGIEPVEPGPVEIDEERRAHEAHIECGDETLAAGDRLCILVAGKRLEGLLERASGDVLERDRLHAASPWFRSSHTLGGVRGSSRSSWPIASATAFAMQTGALIVLPSPIPLAPSAVTGDGDER